MRCWSAAVPTTPLLQCPFHRVPNLVQLFKSGLAQLLPTPAQFVFDLVESRDKFIGRGLQHGFRVEFILAREIDHGKEQIADLIRNRGLILRRDGLLRFACLLNNFCEDIRNFRPIKIDAGRFALCFLRARIRAGSAAGRVAR